VFTSNNVDCVHGRWPQGRHSPTAAWGPTPVSLAFEWRPQAPGGREHSLTVGQGTTDSARPDAILREIKILPTAGVVSPDSCHPATGPKRAEAV
jgi:hypothetical protein